MYSLDDTIAAVGTPIGYGGIGIVRVSGPEAPAILHKVFRPANGNIPGRCVTYGHVVDPDNGETVDEALAFVMLSPQTYTRQNMVEIQAHGGPVPLRRVLQLVLQRGARLAEPGEFTLRAFVNGRLDLAQAEAVRDLIESQTEAGQRMALDQLTGRLSEAVRGVRQQLLDILAYLEASIEFTNDEVPPQDIVGPLESAADEIGRLLREADRGIIYREGIRVAIVGRPNVGKSSLLNALLDTDRAIVTDVPGTTRDTLMETMNLRGVPVVLVDTAGIAETVDRVEQLGISRSRDALQQADVALLVVDGSEYITTADREIAELIGNQTALVIVNKVDLGPPVAQVNELLPSATQLQVSALTNSGLAELEDALADLVLSGRVTTGEHPEHPRVSSPRHKALLALAADHVHDALATHRLELPVDFVAIDVRAAVTTLGKITGESAEADLLDAIFSQFCVGK
jgi:tRNA modification GTPase